MEKIGRYEIKRELGRGGMATVYLAHDPSFGRQVALKALPRLLLHEPTFLERFQREARTIAALEHVAIVPVYDYGQHEGLPFLVMRYMSGGTLSARMARGPLPVAQVTVIMERLADALDYSHSHGVIHRDLKPDNVLFDDRNNPFLSDFGIAKLAEATANLTGSAIIGTPAYMSPEQVHGEAVIDGRADVYALGIILFQMLTGKLPYQADTPARQLMAHVLDPIPSVLAARQDLPPACEYIITRAMAKERDARFDTPGHLAAELKEMIRDRSAPVLPTVTQPRSVTGATGRTTIVDDELDMPAEAYEEPEAVVDLDQVMAEVAEAEPAAPAVAELPDVETSLGPLKVREPEPTLVPAAPPAVPPGRWWLWGGLVLAAVLLAAALWFFTREGAPVVATDAATSTNEPAAETAVSDFIEAKWDEGFDVTTLAAGDSRWAVVMSQGEADTRQTWHTNSEFPADFIESKWTEDFDVTRLAYGDRRWVVVMVRRDGAQQTWHTAADFPGDYIEAKWEEGFDVSDLAYGNGRWALVFERGGTSGQQIWHLEADFPADFIEAKWEEGFDVSDLAYGNGRWVVVMTRGSRDSRQTWHVQSEFPAEYIEAKWEEGFDVSQLTYGDGRWVVVMVQDDENRQQTWQTGSRFN